MLSQTVLISVLVALAEARFGQEQTPISAISAVTSGGQPGQAATLAGQSISTLLAAANPCAKLKQADLILQQLGTGADAVAAARGLVGAEKNFNPFLVKIPSICSDPTLPVNPLLRGVVPLVDPAVDGAAAENANAAKSLKTPFNADGLSVAQVMAANGFTNFSTVDAAGVAGAAPAAGAAAPAAGGAAAPAAGGAAPAKPECPKPTPVKCSAVTSFVTVTRGAAATAAPPAKPAPAPAAGGATPAQGVDPGQQKSSLGLDFGTCTPTIKREAGLNGRKDTEFTFQAIDPKVNKGQQEALNPNIITNRICDQLGNVCGASAAAKDACTKAKAQILALGTRDDSTANAWNAALGFAGTNLNPDNAPQAGLVGHT